MRRKFFAMSLGKDYAPMEEHMFKQHSQGHLPFPTVKQLLTLKGVTKKERALYLNGNIVPEHIYGFLQVAQGITSTQRHVTRVVDERLALLRQLHELGHSVAIADFKEGDFLSERRKNMAKKYGRLVKAELPVRDQIGKVKEIHPNIMWARDAWKKVGPKNRIHFFQKDGTYHQLGEGGMSVDLPGKMVLASKTLANNQQVQKLKQQGHQFIFLNDGYLYQPNLSRMLKTPTFTSWNHIDTFIGTTGKVLLVDHEFFINNRTEIRTAARQAGLEILFIPEAEKVLYPANFLPLNENTILIEKEAKQTIQLLQQHGINAIPTKVSFKANRESGGGVRCIINEL